MKSVCRVLLLVLAGIVVAAAPVSIAAGQERIGKKFVGTYLWFEDSSQRVATITRFGNFSSVSQASLLFRFTDGLGSAIKSGGNEITAQQVNFNFGPDGVPTGATPVDLRDDIRRGPAGHAQLI